MEDNIKDLSRPQMYLFGCSLKADKKEHKVELDDDEAEHQLSLKAVCLGAEAEDKFHTVEMEGLTYDGKTTKITLAVLKPSVLPSLSLGGFEVTPPVSFRLQSGGGPVYISGQHFVSVKESDDEDEEEEEENNTSPVKRPSNMTLAKVPQTPEKKKSADKQNGSPDKKAGTSGKPQTQDKVIWVTASCGSRLGFRFWYSVPFRAVPTKSQSLPVDARGNSYQTSRCSLGRRRHGSLTEKTTG
ncbi:Nucleophosmin [Labeo rohita]|uniref:Nucleophosmin n=1 Tax=Labeo rohita TaxID=84645 RepID=A0ABQ8M4G9_LABRO|nr:Nucleophosmin [Labeo rohita]